jgi:hypothetical protein
MKNTLAFILCIFMASQANAQFGFVGGYKTFNAPEFNEYYQSNFDYSPYPITGWQAGIDYWFRLKKRRIEFAPEITFAQFNQSTQDGNIPLRQFGLHFNVDVYIFDLASDCNCPTFSKDGNMFSKGFFLEVSPGTVFMNNKMGEDSKLAPFNVYYNKNSWAAGGSVGAGLDLGFSDLFTITPLVRFHYYPRFFSLDAFQPAETPESSIQQLFLGLRLRFHFKEVAKYRYR